MHKICIRLKYSITIFLNIGFKFFKIWCLKNFFWRGLIGRLGLKIFIILFSLLISFFTIFIRNKLIILYLWWFLFIFFGIFDVRLHLRSDFISDFVNFNFYFFWILLKFLFLVLLGLLNLRSDLFALTNF